MLCSPMVSRRTGPPEGKLAPSGRVEGARRVTCLAVGLSTVAKGQTWQMVLAITLLLLVSTAACNEEHSAASYQTVPGTSPDYLDSSPFQNSMEMLPQAEKDLQSPSTKGWLDAHSAGGNLQTRDLSASSGGPAGQSHIASTPNVNKISGSLELKPGGQGPQNGDSLDLQSSTGLTPAASPSAVAFGTTTGLSPKLSSQELQPLEINSLPSSLLLQAVETETMELEQTRTVDALPMHFLTSPSSVTSRTVTQQTAFAQETSLNTFPATDPPPSATILTLENPSPSEHITGIEPGLCGTRLASASTVCGVDGDHGGTTSSAETPSSWDRLKEPPHLQSSGSPKEVDASSADLTSLLRTTAAETSHKRMKRFTLSRGATAQSYLVPVPRTYARILSVSPSVQSFVSSLESTSSQQIFGQELDITEPGTREPLSHSSLWPSSSQFEDPTPVALVKSPGSTDSRKTKESSTHWLLEPLGDDRMSWPTPLPATVESPNTSQDSVVSGSRASAENCTEASLRSVFHYGEGLTTGSPNHGWSSVDAPTSPLSQPAGAVSTLQGFHKSETTSGLPSSNASLPVMLLSPNASTDMTDDDVGQLTVGPAAYVSRSFAAEMPGFGPSAATEDLELDTVPVGTRMEADLFVGHQSSVSTEPAAKSDFSFRSMLPSYQATKTTPDTFTVESLPSTPSYPSHLAAGGCTAPGGTSTQVEVSRDADGASFLSRQPLSHPPLYSRGETEYLHSWAPSTALEMSSLEGITVTAHHREWIKTELRERKEQTRSAAETMPTVFSELPLTASEDTPIAESPTSLASAKPEVQSTHKHDALPRQGSEATELPPRDSTYLAVSKQPSELQASSVAERSSSTTGRTPTAGSSPPSYSYVVAALTTTPMGMVPGGTEYVGLVTGGSTDGVPVELVNMTPSEWKVAIATPSHATAASANSKEAGHSSVAPTLRSVYPGFMSSGSSKGSVSVSPLDTEATKGLMARRRWMVPTSTRLSSVSQTEVEASDLSASTATSATYKVASFLLTGAFTVVTNTSAMMIEAARGHKATDAFTEAIGTTTALPMLPTAQAVPMPTIAGSGTLSSSSEPVSSSLPTPLTPLQSTLARLPTSEPLLARQVLMTTLGAVDAQKNLSPVSPTKMPYLKEANTTVLTITTVTEDVHPSKRLSQSTQTLSQSTERDYPILSNSTLNINTVRTLPLQFSLTRIDYTKSLENKSSNSYKKLEKEVKLTLNKMLSSYGSFLHSNVLHFLPGSVVVESEAVFQGEGFVPTPSDVIRTIVTEIEKKKMDTFFDWRVDLRSLWSNGFSLENLEPEVLMVSFTFLGSAAAFGGGLTDGNPLERLRSEVIQLLGPQYQVQDFILHQVGNSQGDLDITGEAYINTSIHVDINWVLEALRGLVNYSVDLSSLSVNGSRLGLQVFPFAFLVTNREANKELLDRSSLEHKTLARDLSDVLMHILRQYKNFLQVKIREITGGSLMCHGDVLFQHPAPSSKDVLKTLALAIGPKDYLATSSLQVDPFSFTVAGDGLEPPFTSLGVPGYGVALIVMCALAVIAVPVLNLLPKILGRKDKIIITRAGDLEVGVETFELDNPGFHFTVEEADRRDTCPQKL